MKLKRRLLLIGILLVICTLAIATQYASMRVQYEYGIAHPSDADIRYIGSDNSSDGIRVLQIIGTNGTNASVKLHLGNISSNVIKTYTAAFGIVNEEAFPIRLTDINVTSLNTTYLKIWVHGNRTANANSSEDPGAVFMYNNGTVMNASNTTAWILSTGDGNSSSMCSNTSDRINNTIPTPWDQISHVRYSMNNSLAVSGIADYFWVQITMDVPETYDYIGPHTGTIWLNFESDTY